MNKQEERQKAEKINVRLIAIELLEEIYISKAYANIALQKRLNFCYVYRSNMTLNVHHIIVKITPISILYML